MNDDRVFIDTNIFVYAKLESQDNPRKQEIAATFLTSLTDPVIISAQVLNEFSNVLIKHKIDNSLILQSVQSIAEDCIVSSVTYDTVIKAWNVRNQYGFSYWDSLILASALENSCKKLYTEDLQHNQTIDAELKVVNPFL